MAELESWQIEALADLVGVDASAIPQDCQLATDVSEYRVYLHPSYYGKSRYHVVTRCSDGGIIIDQTDHAEKYPQRVTLEEDEVSPFLRSILLWYLDDVRERNRRTAFLNNDSFGDLDDHPF